MSNYIDPEVMVGFIAEAKSYLPIISKGIREFSNNPQEMEKLEDAHRYAHTIKGASSMVGLVALSHVAFYLEEAIEKLGAEQLVPSKNNVALLERVIAQIDVYLDSALSGSIDERQLLAEATRTIRRLHGLPEEKDEEAVEQVISNVVSQTPEPEPEKPRDLPETDNRGFSSLLPELSVFEFKEPPPTPVVSEPASGSLENRITGPLQRDAAPELVEVFVIEAEEHIRTMGQSLMDIEHQPDNKELLQQIRRSAHSLKGSAAMVGFTEITKLAHRMEDLLDLLYEDGANFDLDTLKLLFASNDALEDMISGSIGQDRLNRIYAAYSRKLDQQPVVVSVPDTAPLDPSLLANIAEPAQPEVETEPVVPQVDSRRETPVTPRMQRRGQFVRMPIERLDDLINLVSELVITHTAFEQGMSDFDHHREELQTSGERLRRATSRLETQYEATALGGFRLSPFAAPSSLSVPSQLTTFNTHGFDDLEFDRYTEFHILSRELSETSNDIYTMSSSLDDVMGDFETFLNRQGRLYSEIQDKLMRLRMVPLSIMTPRFRRAVRNLAGQQGKSIDLVVEGEDTELDKTVLEEMADSLLHILRNAVDHGIEPPALRQVKGKPAKGVIRLRAYHEGAQIVIHVSDDGAGIEPEILRSEAVSRGYVSSTDAHSLSEEELMSLIFTPGFSTTREISEVSGRGVGLDVVKATVQKLKGTVTVSSRPGEGVAFTVRLPMTLAIARALMVKVGSETYAIPESSITQIRRLERDEIRYIGSEPMIHVGEGVYPVIFLSKALGIEQPAEDKNRRRLALFVSVDEKKVALVVDQILSVQEIVIKNLGNHLRRVPSVMGATLRGDGSVVLILNLSDLVNKGAKTVAPSRVFAPPVSAQRDTLNVMIVDDSPSVRRVVSALIKNAGWNSVVAKDGVEALEMLYAAPAPPDAILLDIEMPRMDGYELLANLRSQPFYKEVPVIMVTSRAGDKHRQKAMDLGASEYVIKPYQDDVLLNLIQKLAREARKRSLR
jgi:chemosensory pili system protein ChpA (sensor histidine kinase/response regulator)